jgi:thiamine biosynthesis lipoprotein
MTRRDRFLRSAIAATLLLTAIGTPLPAQAPASITWRTQTMGTWGSVTMVTADSTASAGLAYESLLVFHRVDSLMSNWTDVSEVARINREAAKGEVGVHPEVAGVLAFAGRVHDESRGAFDITVEPLVRLWGFLGGGPRVPSQEQIDAALELVGYDKVDFDADTKTVRFAREGIRIDLGGIAKGYAADAAADVLREAGAADALVDLSGNMVAIGNAATHDGWTVGVRDPSGERPYVARIHLFDEAVATSGDYEQFVDSDGKRYGHILDPRTGWSASGLSSVTVVCPRAMTADAWATALFVLGPEAARRIAAGRDDLAVVLIEPRSGGNDIVWVEQVLRDRFQIVDELAGVLTVRFF